MVPLMTVYGKGCDVGGACVCIPLILPFIRLCINPLSIPRSNDAFLLFQVRRRMDCLMAVAPTCVSLVSAMKSFFYFYLFPCPMNFTKVCHFDFEQIIIELL